MSPCTIKLLTPAGLQDAPYSADSLSDAVRFEPEGIYTVTNTYNTFQVLKFDAHLDRMEDSARRENTSLRLDRPRLRAALRHMITEAGYGDVRLRVTVPRAQPDHYLLSIEPFSPPSPTLIETGVRCMTLPGMARRNPAAKTNDWAQNRSQQTLPVGIYEGLLVSENGEILEGFGSNFYAVLDGELRTAGAGMLPGIGQQIVFDVAPDIIPMRREAVCVGDIPHLSEAFMTSSSRGVIPIVEIDGILIGDGKPGENTLAILTKYANWVKTHLEEL
jgi:branched-chain amino acid aminotransferase